MKSEFLRHGLVPVLALAVSWFGGIASADTQSGALGKPSGATDLYLVNCFDNGVGAPALLEAQIKDRSQAKPPFVSVQIFKGNAAANTTDPKAGEGSPEAVLNGGPGEYYVAVDKTRKGPKIYQLEFHCVTGSDQHSGMNVVPLQNQ